METRKYPFEETIQAGESFTTQDMELLTAQGAVSVQVEITGDGELQIQLLGSNNDADWLLGHDKIALATGLDKDSGPNGDGKELIGASNEHYPLCTSVKGLFKETGGTDSVHIKGVIAVR